MWPCLHDVMTPRWGCDILWQNHTYTVSHWPCCSHPDNNLVNYCCSVNGEVTSHYNWSILTLMKSNLITLISNLSGPWFGDPNLSDWQDLTGGTAVSGSESPQHNLRLSSQHSPSHSSFLPLSSGDRRQLRGYSDNTRGDKHLLCSAPLSRHCHNATLKQISPIRETKPYWIVIITQV